MLKQVSVPVTSAEEEFPGAEGVCKNVKLPHKFLHWFLTIALVSS